MLELYFVHYYFRYNKLKAVLHRTALTNFQQHVFYQYISFSVITFIYFLMFDTDKKYKNKTYLGHSAIKTIFVIR